MPTPDPDGRSSRSSSTRRRRGRDKEIRAARRVEPRRDAVDRRTAAWKLLLASSAALASLGARRCCCSCPLVKAAASRAAVGVRRRGRGSTSTGGRRCSTRPATGAPRCPDGWSRVAQARSWARASTSPGRRTPRCSRPVPADAEDGREFWDACQELRPRAGRRGRAGGTGGGRYLNPASLLAGWARRRTRRASARARCATKIAVPGRQQPAGA